VSQAAKRPATVGDIEMFTKSEPDQFESHSHELVELRYLHETDPDVRRPDAALQARGDMGGTAIRTMFKHLQPGGHGQRWLVSSARYAEQEEDEGRGSGEGPAGTPHASVILKLNPKTGKMQEYHLTKGWK
jgi:hypothetical protein